jgi:hypothetical protein
VSLEGRQQAVPKSASSEVWIFGDVQNTREEHAPECLMIVDDKERRIDDRGREAAAIGATEDVPIVEVEAARKIFVVKSSCFLRSSMIGRPEKDMAQ